jgi:hypothetical protein
VKIETEKLQYILYSLIGIGAVYLRDRYYRVTADRENLTSETMIEYESIQVYATLSGFPSGASHSHNIIYYSPPPAGPPQERKLPDGELCTE